LAQPACITLLQELCDAGFDVSLETSGALDIGLVDARVSRVVDVKTPDSGEVQRNRIENLALLKPHDQLKFVIGSRADFDWSRRFVADRQLDGRCTILFSPSFGQLPAPQLAQWILDERLNVRFQIQLHKLLWGDVPGR
jgi:7-carboxy-7-deazaguanine synthase